MDIGLQTALPGFNVVGRKPLTIPSSVYASKIEELTDVVFFQQNSPLKVTPVLP